MGFKGKLALRSSVQPTVIKTTPLTHGCAVSIPCKQIQTKNCDFYFMKVTVYKLICAN